MAGRSKATFAKRQREKKKAERASEKREKRADRDGPRESYSVADADELAAFGLGVEEEAEAEPTSE